MSYYIQQRYQDSGWETLKDYNFSNLKKAQLTAKQLSENSIAYGTVRVIDGRGEVCGVFIEGSLNGSSDDLEGEFYKDAIHNYFGLTYANYLVLPRLVLSSMPGIWQKRFVELLDELPEEHIDREYEVHLLEDGHHVDDPLSDYRHGRLE
jgi:hypothetical protein